MHMQSDFKTVIPCIVFTDIKKNPLPNIHSGKYFQMIFQSEVFLDFLPKGLQGGQYNCLQLQMMNDEFKWRDK